MHTLTTPQHINRYPHANMFQALSFTVQFSAIMLGGLETQQLGHWTFDQAVANVYPGWTDTK